MSFFVIFVPIFQRLAVCWPYLQSFTAKNGTSCLTEWKKHVWEVTIFLSLPWKQLHNPFKNKISEKFIYIRFYNSQHFNSARKLVDKYNLLVCSLLYYIIFIEGSDGNMLRSIFLGPNRRKYVILCKKKNSLCHFQI